MKIAVLNAFYFGLAAKIFPNKRRFFFAPIIDSLEVQQMSR